MNITKKKTGEKKTHSNTFEAKKLQHNDANNQKLSIVEEVKERSPRSEISGISNNNISESEVAESDDEEPQRLYDTNTDFIEEHKILPTPPANTQYMKETFLEQAQGIW